MFLCYLINTHSSKRQEAELQDSRCTKQKAQEQLEQVVALPNILSMLSNDGPQLPDHDQESRDEEKNLQNNSEIE